MPDRNQSRGQRMFPPGASSSESGRVYQRSTDTGSRVDGRAALTGADVGHESLVPELKDGDLPPPFEPKRMEGSLADQLPHADRG